VDNNLNPLFKHVAYNEELGQGIRPGLTVVSRAMFDSGKEKLEAWLLVMVMGFLFKLTYS